LEAAETKEARRCFCENAHGDISRKYIVVINQLDAQNLFYNKFISCLYMFRVPCAHRQEVKIVLYSIWYHHTYRWSSHARDGHL
jgi:hypothetical protein